MDRRQAIAGTAALALFGPGAAAAQAGGGQLYGFIGCFTATPGQGAALAAAIVGGVEGMPGCISFIIALDEANPDLVWVTEVWDSKQSHDDSLKLESVKASIAKATPLVASFAPSARTRPVGGVGI